MSAIFASFVRECGGSPGPHRRTSSTGPNRWICSLALGLPSTSTRTRSRRICAPHTSYLGMPTRFFPGRRALTDQQLARLGTPEEWSYANDCADILLASTRGGAVLDRTFMEAFIRPGLDPRNWTSRANYAVHGIIQSSDDELTFYVSHNLGYPTSHVRRYTLRTDGFASVNAPFDGGEMTTKPLTFTGNELALNYSTSAGGSIRVELQNAEGEPIPGFTLAECSEILGDQLDRVVRWQKGTDVSDLQQVPVRLRFVLRDADLFSIQFRKCARVSHIRFSLCGPLRLCALCVFLFALCAVPPNSCASALHLEG